MDDMPVSAVTLAFGTLFPPYVIWNFSYQR
jgi:hypothetical protein